MIDDDWCTSNDAMSTTHDANEWSANHPWWNWGWFIIVLPTWLQKPFLFHPFPCDVSKLHEAWLESCFEGDHPQSLVLLFRVKYLPRFYRRFLHFIGMIDDISYGHRSNNGTLSGTGHDWLGTSLPINETSKTYLEMYKWLVNGSPQFMDYNL